MIIYMYLSILIVISIITGIITTIIDKIKKHDSKNQHVIQSVSFPNKVAKNSRKKKINCDFTYSSLPIIEEDRTFLAQAIETLGFTTKLESVEVDDNAIDDFNSEPVILTIIDQDVL